MGEGSDQLDRQIANIFKQCAQRVSFSGKTAEDLWLWQADRRAGLKEALAVEMPTVYGPPKAQLTSGDPHATGQTQNWLIETDPAVRVRLVLHAGSTTGRPAAVVLKIAERMARKDQEQFCQRIGEMGIVGAATCLRGGEESYRIPALAETYLGLGKSYAGAAAGDLLRIIDYLESQLEMEAEPIILMLAGTAIPVGLTLAAMDQRISGVVIEFPETYPLDSPTGKAPLLINQYLHLGPNPLLTLIQCCVPRPIMMVNYPENEHTDLPGPAGELWRSQPLDQVRETYDIAGHAERLEIIGPGTDRDTFKLLNTFLHAHFAAAK